MEFENVSVTRQYGSAGLGMNICKDLEEFMGGEIKVESRKGHGTMISFKVEFLKGAIMDLPLQETVVSKPFKEKDLLNIVAHRISKNTGAFI